MKHSGILVGACQFYIRQYFFKEYRLKIIKVPQKAKILQRFKIIFFIGKNTFFNKKNANKITPGGLLKST